MPLSVFISNITFFIKNNYNIKKPRNRNRIRFQSRSVIHPYLLFFHFRQSRQRQQNRRYKPKPAGRQRRQPVHIPRTDKLMKQTEPSSSFQQVLFSFTVLPLPAFPNYGNPLSRSESGEVPSCRHIPQGVQIFPVSARQIQSASF